MEKSLAQILQTGNKEQLRALFMFETADSNERVILKFNLWGRKFFPTSYKSDDASFHKDIDTYNLQVYRGQITSFTDIAFRGAAKTTRTKLFFAFAIANDKEHTRRYMKVLSEDGANSKQVVTDVYNYLIQPEVRSLYPEIFKASEFKRQETMSVFTTATKVKFAADTVGTAQRGDIQEDARPDFVWFDDFETRITLKSAVKTQTIWLNMDEARNGLSKGGGCLYTCNYLSERGNVHKLVEKQSERNVVLITPIIRDGVPTWNRFSLADIKQFEEDAEDYAGDYLCEPAMSKDVLFSRERVDRQVKKKPLKDIAGLRLYGTFNPSHAYGMGADVAGGVGLDSSTSVVIDFHTVPAEVVATYDSNDVRPDDFGDELERQATYFSYPILAPEKNNHGHATIGRLKQIYPLDKLFKTQRDDDKVDHNGKKPLPEYGWETNQLTKPKAILGFAKAVNDGLINLNDPKLIAEARSYTRNDLMDAEIDPRLVTRHWDLLMAAAIAWQLKDFTMVAEKIEEKIEETEPQFADIGI